MTDVGARITPGLKASRSRILRRELDSETRLSHRLEGVSGSATTGGVTYQARVAAYFGASILAEEAAVAGFGLPPDAVLDTVWCETTEPVDDVKVTTSANDVLLVQAKRTVDLAISEKSELAKACRQLVASAPSDACLLLAVGPGSSRSVATDLRQLLDGLRPQPVTAPFRTVGLSGGLKQAQDVLLGHLRREWRAQYGERPTSGQLRGLLQRLRVAVLDVEPDGRDATTAQERLRGVVQSRAGAAKAWESLSLFCAELARLRSHADRSGLQRALMTAGHDLLAPSSVRSDVAALNRYSVSALGRLDRHARLELAEGPVTIKRQASDVVAEQLKSNSLLIVGEPGAGKSGVLAAAAQAAPQTKVVIAAEDVEARTQFELSRELGIEGSLHEVLAEWPVKDGLLVIDGLDAARNDDVRHVLMTAIARTMAAAPHFRLAVSVRTYDLRYDQELRDHFAGHLNIEGQWAAPEFAGLSHVFVGPLVATELGQLSRRAPALHEFIQSAPPALTELIRNVFNLRLLSELLQRRVDEVEALRQIDSQIGLLDAYWNYRVRQPRERRDAREQLLVALCRQMVADQQLAVDRSTVREVADSLDLDGLLVENVLVERELPNGLPNAERLGFSHNVLFDYAVATLLLRPHGALLAVLVTDRSAILRLRPSIELHLRWLWQSDPTRETFFSEALAIAQSGTIGELPKTAAPAVAAELATTASDLDPLRDRLTDEGADNVLGYLIGWLATFGTDTLVVGPRQPWAGFASELTEHLTPGRRWLARGLVNVIEDHRDAASTDVIAHLGTAARALAADAWREPVDEEILVWAVREICTTYLTDPRASADLLRRALTKEQLEQRGYRLVPAMSFEIGNLITADPSIVGEIYRAAFTYEEESQDQTPMGASRLVPLTSTRRQDFGMARHSLGEAFGEFLTTDPVQALDALDVAVCTYVERRYSNGRLPANVRLPVGDHTLSIRSDHSHIWDQPGGHDDVEKMLDAVQAWCEKADEAPLQTALEHLASRPRPAAIWRRVLAACARNPRPLAHSELAALFESPRLFLDSDLHHPASQALAAVHDATNSATRRAIEQAVLDMPRRSRADVRAYTESRRDSLLASLTANLALDAARERRQQLDAAAEPPPPIPPSFRPRAFWSGPVTDEEAVRESGGDPNQQITRELLDLRQPLREFADQYLNGLVPPVERQRILPALKRMKRAIEDESFAQADVATAQMACGALADVAERLARGPATLTKAQAKLVLEILLTSATHPEPSSTFEGFDEHPCWGADSPRIAAAEGLTVLAYEARWATPEVLASVETLAADPIASVRFAVAQHIGGMVSTAPELVWRVVESRLSAETSRSVLQAVIGALARISGGNEDKVLDGLSSVLRRERRREEPREQIVGEVYAILAALYVWRGEERARTILRPLVSDPASLEQAAGEVIQLLRDPLIHGSEDESHTAIRRRAIELIIKIARAVTATVSAIHDSVPADSAWDEGAAERYRSALRVAHTLTNELYFASGVFDAKQNRPGPNIEVRYRLFDEAREALEELARLGRPEVVHHLVELLEGCIDHAPREVFLIFALAIRSGASQGYQFESLAVTVFCRIVQRYLAGHRELFEDPALARDLLEILDVFVGAGWPQARRLVYGLDELYR